MRAFLALLATPALGFSAPATLASAPVATKHAPAHAFDHILEGLTAQADGDIAAAKECFTAATPSFLLNFAQSRVFTNNWYPRSRFSFSSRSLSLLFCSAARSPA